MTPFTSHRRAGILLHPTSLPSGVLDADAERWLDTLETMGCSLWQVLPLGEPQMGLSPYQCVSAFAMNPALLTDFGEADFTSPDFIAFCAKHSWLDDYVLYMLLHDAFDSPWFQWPEPYRRRDEETLSAYRDAHKQAYDNLAWRQYELHRRWHQVRHLANARDIILFGDMPIFVAYDSVDVWVSPRRFRLDESGAMTVVTGVPPDYFSETGQRWGNPHYDWQAHREEGFAWWLERIRYHLELFDLVRIDHFRGLEASWVIDAECDTAIDGYWEEAPGDELLAMVERLIGRVPIVAEDLGVITPEVTALRERYGLPGMSVLQFGFDVFDDNPHKPKNIDPGRVVYTGTHDNDTTVGWFEELDDNMQAHVCEVLGIDIDKLAQSGAGRLADTVVDALVDSGMNSQASLCIIPLQDVLHLGSSARMNTPGTIEGNWRWSFEWQQIEKHTLSRMRHTIKQSGRLVTHD